MTGNDINNLINCIDENTTALCEVLDQLGTKLEYVLKAISWNTYVLSGQKDTKESTTKPTINKYRRK